MSVKKVIKDFQEYLGGIEELAKKLEPEQQDSLKNILSVQLCMLVSLKQASNLGEVSFKHLLLDHSEKIRKRRNPRVEFDDFDNEN